MKKTLLLGLALFSASLAHKLKKTRKEDGCK